MEERRRYKRSSIANTGIKSVEVNGGAESERIDVVDFSYSGLAIIANKPFPLDANINIALALSKEEKIALTGKVIWSQSKEETWRIGISLCKNLESK